MTGCKLEREKGYEGQDKSVCGRWLEVLDWKSSLLPYWLEGILLPATHQFFRNLAIWRYRMTVQGNNGRLHMRIDPRLKALVTMEARRRRITERAIVEAALRERYEPEQAKQEDSLLLAEVRGLRRDLGRVEFGHCILVELFTLTVHNLFQRLPSPTDASRLAGTAFYNALVASVEKVFTQGDPLLDKLVKSLLEAGVDSCTEIDGDLAADSIDNVPEP